MSLSKVQADAQLAEIDDVVRRVKQSRIYRVAGAVAIIWGGLQIAQFAIFAVAPDSHRWTWLAVDVLGVASTVLMLRRAGVGGGGRLWRALGAFALFYGFGFVWSGAIGHFGPRETAVFWRSLFLFGYCLAGLWFGLGFLGLGLSLTALILAIYVFAGPLFWPLIALVTGFGYILCGLWMRRA